MGHRLGNLLVEDVVQYRTSFLCEEGCYLILVQEGRTVLLRPDVYLADLWPWDQPAADFGAEYSNSVRCKTTR